MEGSEIKNVNFSWNKKATPEVSGEALFIA